jgi:hypothetical protein
MVFQRGCLAKEGARRSAIPAMIGERLVHFVITSAIGSTDDSIVTLCGLNTWQLGFAAYAKKWGQ